MSVRVLLWIVVPVSVFFNGFLVYVIERKNQEIASLGKEQKTGNAANISDGFFAHLEKLSQDESQKEEHTKIIDRVSRVVIQEAKTHPDSMAYFFDEIVPLAAKFGVPGFGLQVLEYADEAVRQEMQRLKEESNVAQLLEKEKVIHGLKKENAVLSEKITKVENELKKLQLDENQLRYGAFLLRLTCVVMVSVGVLLVARLIQLEKKVKHFRKIVLGVQERENLFSNAVPVLLEGWSDSHCKMKITNKHTQETKMFTLGWGALGVAHLYPGEYSVVFTSERFPNINRTSTYLVLSEAKHEHNGVKYHGWIKAPGGGPHQQ